MLMQLEHTQQLAKQLAGQVQMGDVLALSGEVGAGKTTFAQAFIGALLPRPEPVTSPTFTLVQHYQTHHHWSLLHADLYRLRHAEELSELGLEDAFDSHVSLIEWPEIAAAILPSHSLHLHLSHGHGDARHLRMESADPRWKPIIEEWSR